MPTINFAVGIGLILIEGSICIAMALPIFCVVASLGGLLCWIVLKFVDLPYAFGPDSFPPGTLDEHVLIGGRHFDLVDTSCRLVPEAGGTRLEIVVDYRVSTHFNW